MNRNDWPHQNPEHNPEPDLFPKVAKNVWREVYQGRWAELARIQKAEFIVEVLFFGLFTCGFSYFAYVRGGNWLGLIVTFGGVGAILGAFFFLLTRFIR